MTPVLSGRDERPVEGLSLAWFATGRGQMSGKLLAAVREAIETGRLNADIAVVFCNRAPGEDENTDAFLEQVRASGIPLLTLSSRDFRKGVGGPIARKGEALPEWRREYDREVMRALEPYEFDLGVLAGFMLIFGEEAAARWDLLNLHPAAPGGPSGMWQDVIWKLIEQNADRAGVMVHLATPELDGGPVVTYCTYPIRGGIFDSLWRLREGRTIDSIRGEEGEDFALFRAIRNRGVEREIPLIIETLRALSEGDIRILNKTVSHAGHSVVGGLDLTDKIEALVRPSLEDMDAKARRLSFDRLPDEIKLFGELLLHINSGAAQLSGQRHDRGLNLLVGILVGRAFNSLWRSREDAIDGYYVQSLSLCRGALEDWGTAVWVVQHPNDIDLWLWAVLPGSPRPERKPPSFAEIWAQVGPDAERVNAAYKLLSKFAHPRSVGLSWLVGFDDKDTFFRYGSHFDEKGLEMCFWLLIQVTQAFLEQTRRLQVRTIGAHIEDWMTKSLELTARAKEVVDKYGLELSTLIEAGLAEASMDESE